MTNNNDYYKDETSGNNERASLGNDSTRDFSSIDFNKNFNNNNELMNNSNGNNTTTTTTTTTSTSPGYNNYDISNSNSNSNNNSNNSSSNPNNDDLEFANQLKNVQKQMDSNTGFVLNNVDTILSNNQNNNQHNNKFNDDQLYNHSTNPNKSISFNFNNINHNNNNNNNNNNINNTYSINDNDIDNQNDFGEEYDLPNNSTTSQDYNTYSGLRKNANIIKVCAFLLMSFSFISYFSQAWWLLFSFGFLACPLGIYSAHNLLKYPFTIFIGYLLVDMLFRIIYFFTHLSYLKGFGVFLALFQLALEGYFTYFCRQFQVVMPINGRVTYREFYIAMGGNGIFDC